ncbi:MAG: c-type cytochrome [Alphaproteobacteria bacterium]
MILRLMVLACLAGAAGLIFLAWPRSPLVQVPEGFDVSSAIWGEKGAWLATAAGCKSCHTVPGGAAYAGGRALETPFGTFYSPNLTPDETGLAGWAVEDFVRAVRHGVGKGGVPLYPTFPYASYARMTDADAAALYAYFMSLAPVRNEIAAHNLPLAFKWRGVLNGWRTLFLEATALDPEKNRGRYLAEALGHCGECHTPRTPLGNLDHTRRFEGTPHGPDGEKVPAITAAALADWSVDDIAELLKSGFKPDYDNVQGSMGEVVAESTSRLDDADRQAIAAYLKQQ